MKIINVFIADDHPVYREGLAQNWEGVPQINVIGSAGDGKSALEAIRQLKPDVAVMDLKLPELDGMQVLELLFAEDSPTSVLVLTAYMDSTTVYRALTHGARGFLEKAASFSEITEAVLQIGAGGTIIAPFAQDVLARELRTRQNTTEKPILTSREVEILRLAADGHSGQKIASELHISLTTVKTHLQHIYDKLDVSDRASAVAQAIRRGFLRW
ncbi:response regulator transcription factor [Pseudarthrobacter sp. AB1]|uniref:response regulator n=1 Tax=Pseudarthrobacter sp. AB1 TaxID=2138309 RepID=UPI00186B71EA|nr:response regulator transcription factor [Pseudarthrobacter sp. AB1]MBE4718175.1 DNA-binding response regulator [Pseudarthrobacter sp. AB1]